jgi:leucyl-tRNA---protein transferase
MTVSRRFVVGPDECLYLPDRRMRLEYELVARLSPQEYERRMDQGWRKFGRLLFHPVCDACRECRPIRIPVDRFTPDRSQRRALRANADLSLRWAPPIVDAARLDLYRRYHASQADRKGWPEVEKDAEGYAVSFAESPIPAGEMTVWEGEALRAVVIADVTPNVLSAVYHFHDPDCRERGLGTFACCGRSKGRGGS